MSSSMVVIEGVSKKFQLAINRKFSTLGNLVSMISGQRRYKDIEVLNDVSMTIHQGEIIGLIGRNGCGKSTLLRTMAGIYQADQGSVDVKGKLVYVAGFGQGLRRELSMKENIFLGAALMGLTESVTRRILNDIVEFSGLKEFVDGKLDHFSSGMAGRLAFSISLFCVKHHRPDILLLDEVFFAEGDVDFNTKALRKMEDLLKEGSAVVLVSHNMQIIKQYCPKTFWLEKGTIQSAGTTSKVVEDYLRS